ncbi:hypothetical protein ACXYTJ_07770 [Gilvimarinus sp. F26214L]|uniref:hypothetical protein n=1 Tax=Gilvimarinus sp. DZF01 TaxID=3461371 RepID=UPI0040466671
MRALAEFIMRGRAQAAAVALFGAFVPFVSPSAVTLVSLRRGGYDGFFVIAWAMLPVIVMAVVSPETLPMAYYTLCVLVAALGGALVLRSQSLWPVSVMSLVVLSATGGMVYGFTFPAFNEQLVDELNQAQERAAAQMQQEGGGELEPPTISGSLISGLMASLVAFHALLALVIGRWWQALLYNPGGFREEFYQFRLSKTQALICFGIAAVCVAQPNWLFWGFLAALPLVLVTTAVVHNRVRAKDWGVPWLILFYLLMLFQPFFLLAVFAGFTDSWVDYRRRFGPPLPQEHENDR